MSIAENIKKIQNKLSELNALDVRLIAVSKYADIDQICEAYQAGLRDFGENYVLPALKKREELLVKHPECRDIKWHLIGHLQKNKVNKAVGNFDLIHSVDSMDLAQAINERSKKLSVVQEILFQCKLTDEESKTGIDPEELMKIMPELVNLHHIKIRGLMLMASSQLKNLANKSKENILRIQRNTETIYEKMSQIKREILSENLLTLTEKDFVLSMGMSNDYELAIKHGSNLLRIGRNIFGE